MSTTTVQVVTGHRPNDIVAYAAAELATYVDKLFHIDAAIVDAAGDADATIYLDPGAAGLAAPDDEQSFILKRADQGAKPALAAIGGSPAATLWAVYDLAERWGVRYLLKGDVLPPAPRPFHLPDIDILRSPNLRFRGVRLINLFSMGLESWSLADIKRYIDQLTKLKFNNVYHQLWCWQPYVHYEYRGVAKGTGTHWFGWHYPIDEHTIGRHHFRGQTEFVPPDFEGCQTYQDRVAVGRHVVRESLAHAKLRGFGTQICTVLTDFPVEFAHTLGMPPIAPHGMGLTLSAGHKGADDQAYQELVATALRAYIDTYPDVDSYVISMPEFHIEQTPYQAAWQRLDEKYSSGRARSLEQILDQAETRSDYPGGASRIVRAVKGDLVALDLFDRLLTEQKILDDCSKPDADIQLTGLSEELAEVYNAMQPGARCPLGLDYTTSRMVKRPEAFERVRQAGLRPRVTMTTQDDNIGVLPQLATASIHEMLGILRQSDWEGFQLRYWMICEMDPTVAYLSAATWDDSATPESAYRDHAVSLCGQPAQSDLLEALRMLDQITIGLGDHGLGIGFPVPGMGINHWNAGDRLPEELLADCQAYGQALDHARRARAQATRGHDQLDYLIGRLEFGIGYLEMVDQIKQAGQANKEDDRDAAVAHLEQAVRLAQRIVTIHAGITRDGTDLGTLAQLNEDLYRKLSRLLEAVRAGKKWTKETAAGSTGVLVE